MGTRHDDSYELTEAERTAFARDGWVHLPGVLSEEEIRAIEVDYQRLIHREIAVEGRDYCDMAGGYGRAPDEFTLINVMLPRRYHPVWQGNLYERRCASIAAQLCGAGMTIDYDQLLAKRPGADDAVFHWHQDMAYWIDTPDTRTATCWLALDDSDVGNGCMRFVSGSHREASLRSHRPLHGDRDASHTLLTDVTPDDVVTNACIARGDVTVHDERVLHGSGPNTSDRWRRAYVVAFRAEATVAEERRRGFTHSHNDAPDVLDSVGIEGESKPDEE